MKEIFSRIFVPHHLDSAHDLVYLSGVVQGPVIVLSCNVFQQINTLCRLNVLNLLAWIAHANVIGKHFLHRKFKSTTKKFTIDLRNVVSRVV